MLSQDSQSGLDTEIIREALDPNAHVTPDQLSPSEMEPDVKPKLRPMALSLLSGQMPYLERTLKKERLQKFIVPTLSDTRITQND